MSSDCHGGKVRVMVIGAGGGVGQPVSLLMKRNKRIQELVLFDIADIKGMAMDLSHIDSPTKVIYYSGKEKMKCAMEAATMIVMVASARLDKEITREAFFDANAGLIKGIAETMAEVAPKAMFLLFSNPVNSLVPLICEVMRKAGKLDPRRIFGISSLDVVRASTFVAEAKCLNPLEVKVPVVGGHSFATMVPLLSQTKPPVEFTEEEAKTLSEKIINGGIAVLKALGGRKSATLSSAHAINRLASSVLDGLAGKPNVIDYAIVKTDICETRYFGAALLLGKHGVEKVFDIGPVNDREKKMLEKIIPAMKAEVKLGEDYVLKGGGSCKA